MKDMPEEFCQEFLLLLAQDDCPCALHLIFERAALAGLEPTAWLKALAQEDEERK